MYGKRIYDPPTPYVGPILTRFAPGQIIRIQGTVPAVAYRFNINLQCGSEITPRDDIALHISVLLLNGFIALNSLQQGTWGEEKRIYILPIKRAERFEIILKCEFRKYKVMINGQHYCDFAQRIHYDRISHLSINGDVSVILISYESDSCNGPSEPSIFNQHAPIAPQAFDILNSIDGTFLQLREQYSALESSDPPSYEEAVSGALHNSSSHTNNITYPTSTASAPPYSTHSPARPPYSTTSPSDMPNPRPATGFNSTYDPPGRSLLTTVPLNANPSYGIRTPPLSAGAPIPLNANTSYFHRLNELNDTPQELGCTFVISLAIVIIIVVVVVINAYMHDLEKRIH